MGVWIEEVTSGHSLGQKATGSSKRKLIVTDHFYYVWSLSLKLPTILDNVL